MNYSAVIRDAPTSSDLRPVKIACHNLWKVFGEGAAAFIAKHGAAATLQEIAAAKLVGAVRNASLEVREGEIFIETGFLS